MFRSSSVEPKIALLVMGVARSGTSALARVLSLLGAGLPRDIMGPGLGNERGFWESNRIVALSDEMLGVHSSDWFDPRPFPRRWFANEEAMTFVDRAAALLENDYEGAPLIVVKDPRICRLVPIYTAALERAGYSARVVVTLRHPIEVIESLRRLVGTAPLVSELIWIRHILEMEASTRNALRVWVTYDNLLENWYPIQAMIAAKLDILWPKSPDRVAEEIAAFLEPNLRHFDLRRDQLCSTIGSLASKVWSTARFGLTGDEAALQTGFDEIRLVVDEVDRLNAAQIEQERLRGLCAASEIQMLSRALECKNLELGRLRAYEDKGLADSEVKLNQLRVHAAACEAQIAAMQVSRSWRLTRPLRALGSALRRGH